MKINTENLKRQLEIVFNVEDGNTVRVWWQTATDNKAKKESYPIVNGKRQDPLAQNFQATLPDALQRLTALSNRGAAVWWLAATAKTRRIDGVTHLPCLRLEVDGDMPECPIQPSIINKTPNGYHLYFVVENGIKVSEYPELVRRAIAALSGDTGAKDITRVLRVVGFPHQKNQPTEVVQVFAEHIRYSVDDLLEAFPALPVEPQQPVRTNVLSVRSTEVQTEADYMARVPKCARLYSGDDSDYGNDKSRGDAALSMYAVYLYPNAHDAEAFMRRSARYRDKWDVVHSANGETYLQHLISTRLAMPDLKPKTNPELESVINAYTENKEVVLKILANRNVHHATLANYLTIMHGIFTLLEDKSIKKELSGNKLLIRCGWKQFCSRFQLDATKARGYRQYLEGAVALGFHWDGEESWFSLPATNPREWLQTLTMTPLLSLAVIKGRPSKPSTSTRLTHCRSRTGTRRIPRAKAVREHGSKGIEAAIIRDKRRKLVNPKFHRREFFRLERDLRAVRSLCNKIRQRKVFNGRMKWLERRMTYHAEMYNRLN